MSTQVLPQSFSAAVQPPASPASLSPASPASLSPASMPPVPLLLEVEAEPPVPVPLEVVVLLVVEVLVLVVVEVAEAPPVDVVEAPPAPPVPGISLRFTDVMSSHPTPDAITEAVPTRMAIRPCTLTSFIPALLGAGFQEVGVRVKGLDHRPGRPRRASLSLGRRSRCGPAGFAA